MNSRPRPCLPALVPNLGGGRFGFEARLAVATFRDEIRVGARAAPEDPRRKDQRFGQNLRILERQVVEDGVSLTPELLDDVHVRGVEVAATPDPCRVDE